MCGSQLHTHRSPTTRGGNEKLPQGFGSQGSTSIGSIAKKEAKLVGLTKKINLLKGSLTQLVKGSPWYPGLQAQVAM